MKLSDAILKGMERFPRQAVGEFQEGDDAACAIGCANWAIYGNANVWITEEIREVHEAFIEAYECSIFEANDSGLLREDIVGMLQAIGE